MLSHHHYALGSFVLLVAASVRCWASVEVHCVQPQPDAEQVGAEDREYFLVYSEHISWYGAHARCREQRLEFVSDPPRALLDLDMTGIETQNYLFYINAHRTLYASSDHTRPTVSTQEESADAVLAALVSNPALSDGRPLSALCLPIAPSDEQLSPTIGRNCFAIDQFTISSNRADGKVVKAIDCAQVQSNVVRFACRLEAGRSYNRIDLNGGSLLKRSHRCADGWQRAEYFGAGSERLGLPLCVRSFRVPSDTWDEARLECRHAGAELFAPTDDLQGLWFEHWAAERLADTSASGRSQPAFPTASSSTAPLAVFVDAHQSSYCGGHWCWRTGRELRDANSGTGPLKWLPGQPDSTLFREYCTEYKLKPRASSDHPHRQPPQNRGAPGGLNDIMCDTPAHHPTAGRGVALCVRELDMRPRLWFTCSTGQLALGVALLLAMPCVVLLALLVRRLCVCARHCLYSYCFCEGHRDWERQSAAADSAQNASELTIESSVSTLQQQTPYQQRPAPPQRTSASSRRLRSASVRVRVPRAPDWMDSMKSLYESSSSLYDHQAKNASERGKRQIDTAETGSQDENYELLEPSYCSSIPVLSSSSSPPLQSTRIVPLNALDSA